MSTAFRAGVTVVVVLIVSIGAVTAGPFAIASQEIVVETTDGEQLIVEPVFDDTEIELRYTHSVERSLVVERYVVNESELVNTEIVFSSYGAGLPAQADVTQTDDGQFRAEPNVHLKELYIQPGSSIADHELEINGNTYELSAHSETKTVRIYVVDRTVPIAVTMMDGA
ncbi:DUF1850 domain-containing protein [Halalkalirubrum salinum]|uniref:DUF1850 domain-containing protein n=1 Tax=Halalkalirubrum salinum TaxID=2563889 RepID=UPI0010FB2761|nr:DUF1850 domain-containing protein [Halalkalirubrum salinum]